MAIGHSLPLTTDYRTQRSISWGQVKGVILNIFPDVEMSTLGPFRAGIDAADGAPTIAQSYSYFPSGTVHLVVVDPGVGTDRRAGLRCYPRRHRSRT